MKKEIKRNGDWTFIATDVEAHGKELKHNGTFIFATGEATNHHHAIAVKNKEDMKLTKMSDGSYLITLTAEATVTHPEHSQKKDLYISPGTYKLTQKREKDWFSLATRKIID